MIIFKKIRWKNLLSTGNNFVEINLNDARSTILIGKSGSGKSTLLDAISFALFNKPFRNINKNQLVNSINQKDCLVEIEFTIGTKNYLVRRGIKPSVFEIYQDDKLVGQDSHNKDYQQFLEKSVLNFNFKAFTQIVVLGASNFTPFMQLKPADRRIIIESLLDIEIFSVMNSIIKKKLSELKSELLDIENSIIIEAEKKDLQEQYIKDASEDRQKKITDNISIIKDNEKQILLIESSIAELKGEIQTLNDSISFKSEVESNINKISNIEQKLKQNISNLKKKMSFYNDNSACPTCNQKIDEDFKSAELNASSSKIDEYNLALEDIKKSLIKFNSRLSDAESIESEIRDKDSDVSKKLNSIYAIKKFIEKVRLDNDKLEKTQTVKEKYASNLNDIQQRIESLEEQKKELLYSKSLYDISSTILKDDGVKAKIIKQYLPLINKHTNIFLNSMNFFVVFNIDEEFNESIKSRGRDDFSYENFSEGEKQRIDLALLLTWRTIAKMKNSINTNLLIMDEVLDSYLDNSATENVLQLLNSELFANSNIFVISHKETISDKFNKVLSFAKIKNFTSLV